MRRALALISVMGAASLLGFLVPSASAVSVARGGTIGTFSDRVGEIAGAPDISTVTVSLDGGVLTVEAQVSGMPSLLSDDGSLMFMLNTDSNTATGKLRGADYVLFLDVKTLSGAFMQWNGSDYVPAAKAADPTRTLIGGRSAGFMFHLANFGSPTHIEFGMAVVKGQPEGGLIDMAPDSGLWAFDTVAPTPAPAPAPTPAPAPAPKPTVVKPMIGAPVTTPLALIAGQRTSVAFRVTRSDNGRPLTSGRMICDPSVAGKVISHTESFKAGIARLSFLVPKTAKGKLLKVKVTIKAGNQSATKIVAFRVK